jgi:hypothetical protein
MESRLHLRGGGIEPAPCLIDLLRNFDATRQAPSRICRATRSSTGVGILAKSLTPAAVLILIVPETTRELISRERPRRDEFLIGWQSL